MVDLSDSGQAAGSEHDTGYYAVDAQRVIQIFELFKMRPSHFSAGGKSGAQSVYYDARKIVENRTNNKWGHHTSRAIKNFCYFTRLDNEAEVPWQELIEHSDFYDGKEGAGRRTSNLLQTVNRMQVSVRAIATARLNAELEQSLLAEKVALPLRFIEILEQGEWPTVCENTADAIESVLGADKNTLFTRISEPVSDVQREVHSEGLSTADAKKETQPGIRSEHQSINRNWLLLAPLFGFVFWLGYSFYPSGNPGENISGESLSAQQTGDRIVGCWNWSNNTHIVIDKEGAAHNGPLGASWEAVDTDRGEYQIIWASFVDTLSLSANGDVLSGQNNYGIPISATRKAGEASELTGTWLWSNGISVVIKADSTVRGGTYSGNWHKAGDNWVIEWPLVDSIRLSDDGNHLNVKNQFALLTASRDVGCKRK